MDSDGTDGSQVWTIKTSQHDPPCFVPGGNSCGSDASQTEEPRDRSKRGPGNGIQNRALSGTPTGTLQRARNKSVF